jgi:hypothetical protein
MNYARMAPLLSSGDRPAPRPSPLALAALLRSSSKTPAPIVRAGVALPTEGGNIEPPILTEGPGSAGDPRVGPMPWDGSQPSLTVSGNGPRLGGVFPPGALQYQDPEATDADASATVRGGGPDFGEGQMFGSVPIPGGFGPPDTAFSGTPSLYSTSWTFDPQLGWVPQAQQAGGQNSFAGGGTASGRQNTGFGLPYSAKVGTTRLMTLLGF